MQPIRLQPRMVWDGWEIVVKWQFINAETFGTTTVLVLPFEKPRKWQNFSISDESIKAAHGPWMVVGADGIQDKSWLFVVNWEVSNLASVERF